MPSNRRFRQLVGAWGAYWLVLAGVGLGPMIWAILQATRGPNDNTSSVNANVGNGGLSVSVVHAGVTTYTSSIHFLTAALWIAGPPLLAWLVFVLSAKRDRERELV